MNWQVDDLELICVFKVDVVFDIKNRLLYMFSIV